MTVDMQIPIALGQPNITPSHVGQVIHSTTLDTLAKVQEIYGESTTWIQLDGYVLRGATTSVTPNQNLNDGGADNVTVSSVASHNHTQNAHTHTQNAHKHSFAKGGSAVCVGTTTSDVDAAKGFAAADSESRWWNGSNKAATDISNTTATNQNATATNQANGANYTVNTLPKYKNVYIWERTA